MIYEFEGKTEREAIDKAVSELGLQSDQFDVEIVEIQKNSLFKKGYAKIRVHIDGEAAGAPIKRESARPQDTSHPVEEGAEKEVLSFIDGLIRAMGYTATIDILSHEEQ